MKPRSVKRTLSDGNTVRFYSTDEFELPSVTTILSVTKDDTFIKRWRERVGEKEADKILKESTERGTYLHDWLEIFFKNGFKDFNEIMLYLNKNHLDEFERPVAARSAKSLFDKVMASNIQNDISRYIMSEKTVYNKIEKNGNVYGYAGKFDLMVEDIEGKTLLLDWKNARAPKKEEWVEDYKLQISAYYKAVMNLYDINVDYALIVIANEKNDTVQQYKLDSNDLEQKYLDFKERLKRFYKLVQ
jgi:genome maintenance exonuclease 1